ncbi:hypothetical protein ACHAXS_005566 [Conticribra weissflogii]
MIHFVAKFILPQQRQPNKFRDRMAPSTKNSRANPPHAGTDESEPVPIKAVTSTHDESKHCQHDEQNPQDVSSCKDEVKLNIDRLRTNEDLDALKIDDPFMFYSIPAVKKAEYFCQNVDVTKLKMSHFRRNTVSCPGRMENEDFLQPTRAVKRKSCISFECHSNAFFPRALMISVTRKKTRVKSLMKMMFWAF